MAAKLLALLRQTAVEWLEDRVPRMGAALAYYSVFSVAPLLLIAVATAGMVFGEQAARKELHSQLGNTLGSMTAAAIEEILGQLHSRGGGLLGSIVGGVVLLFGASGVFAELQDSLNSIWKVKANPRSGLWSAVVARLFSFVLVLGTGFLLLALVVVGTVWNGLEHFVDQRLAFGERWWWLFNQAFSLALVGVLFAAIYKILPETHVAWREVWPGAVLAAMLFEIGKFLIAEYLTRGAIASAFGAAGSVIVVLTWVYYTSQIVLFGAEFTRVYASHMRTAAASSTRPGCSASA